MFGGMSIELVLTAIGGLVTGIFGAWATIKETNSKAETAVFDAVNGTLATMSEALDRSLERTDRHSQDITNLSTQISTQGMEISDLRHELRRNESKFDSSCMHIARREHWTRMRWPEGRPQGLPTQ